MTRIGVIGALLALGGCATAATGTAGGESRLAGQDLQAAVGLYGPWQTHVELAGAPTYIWRRSVRGDDQVDYYCELRVQMGFRTTISRTQMQGYPQACRLFAAGRRG